MAEHERVNVFSKKKKPALPDHIIVNRIFTLIFMESVNNLVIL